MDTELSILLHKTKDTWLKRKLEADEANIPSYMPPIPEYQKVKIPFSRANVVAFAKNFIIGLRP